MKIDRLIGIIAVLMQNDRITAPRLAELFEVSRRTINRDIDDLCRAGIPVVTERGTNGGIYISSGYKLDKTLLKANELGDIVAGLLGLQSVSQDSRYKSTILKLTSSGGRSSMDISLSSHYRDSLSPKIAAIREAIEGGRELSFNYFNRSGERRVFLLPYSLVYRWSSWYVLGETAEGGEFKLYKLNRLTGLSGTGRTFTKKAVPESATDFESYFTDGINVVILFHPSVRYRIIEEYGALSHTVLDNGFLRFEFSFTNEDYLISWLLSFGENAELLEPKNLRKKVLLALKNTMQHYPST